MTGNPVSEVLRYPAHGVACFVCGYPVETYVHYRNARMGAVIAYHGTGTKCVIHRVRLQPETVQTAIPQPTDATSRVSQTMDGSETGRIRTIA